MTEAGRLEQAPNKPFEQMYARTAQLSVHFQK